MVKCEVLNNKMIETAERTAMVYTLIIGGSIVAFFVGVTQLPVSGLSNVTLAPEIYILLGMVMVVEIGLLTQPFGMNCFIIKAVAADVPLSKVFKGFTPFISKPGASEAQATSTLSGILPDLA